MSTTKNINLDLSLDEVNVILESLGKLPFEKVYNVIHKIHNQANTQAEEPENADPARIGT